MHYRSASSFSTLHQSYSTSYSDSNNQIVERYSSCTPTVSYPSSFGTTSYDTTNKCYYISFFVENAFWNNGDDNTSLSACIPILDQTGNTFAYYTYDGINLFINLIANDYGADFIMNEWTLYIMVYFNQCNARAGNINLYLFNPLNSVIGQYDIANNTISNFDLSYYFYAYYYRPDDSGDQYTEHNGGTLITLDAGNLASWYALGGECYFTQNISSPGVPQTTDYTPCCNSLEYC